MEAQVFISYSSQDEVIANKVRVSLERRAISCFYAPRSIRVGEIFSDKIASDIRQCQVLLLLWSKDAAESEYVQKEISAAGDARLFFFPVQLDDAERSRSFYLQDVNWVRWKDHQSAGIAELVWEHLRASRVSYPLDLLYQEAVLSDIDVAGGVEALRLLIRFIALVQIARYCRRPRSRLEAVNRQIETALSVRSLFADLAIIKQITSALENADEGGLDGPGGLFREVPHGLPTLEEFIEDGDAAEAFDRERLPKLLEGVESGQVKSQYELRQAIRRFLTRELSNTWACECQFSLSLGPHEPDHRQRIEGPPMLSAEDAGRARLWISGPWGALEATPFFALLDSRETSEIGVLRSQSEVAAYSGMDPVAGMQWERPLIRLPWGQLDAKRQLPKVFYCGEEHEIILTLTNNSSDEAKIATLDEQLPDNLIAENGGNVASVARNLNVPPGQTLEAKYRVRGGADAGVTRLFPTSTIHYLYRGEMSSVGIEGQNEAEVRSLPTLKLTVERILEDLNGQVKAAKLALDSTIVVRTTIRHEGARIEHLKLEEEITGGEILGESPVLHDGPIGRMDLQPPIVREYRLRVTDPKSLSIRLRLSGEAKPIEVEGGELRRQVVDMPAPRVELRWLGVSRVGPRELEAVLRIQNTGGTSAAGMLLHADTPAGVTVQPVAILAERAEAGADRALAIRVTCAGIPSGIIHFSLKYSALSGEVHENSIILNLGRVVETNLDRLTVEGRKECREEIVNALRSADSVVVNLHGPRGSGKRRLLHSEVNRLVRSEGMRIELIEVDCRLAGSFREALAILLDKIITRAAAEGKRASDSAFTDFLKSCGMEEREYGGYVPHLKTLLQRTGPASDGTWYAAALLLSKFCAARQFEQLILAFQDISFLHESELEGLTGLRRNLDPRNCVRIVVTSQDAVQAAAIDREVEIPLLSDEDCRELIGRVFIMPRASESLELDLIERSGRLPGSLISLLRQLAEEAEELIDFDSPMGGRIADYEAYRRLANSIFSAERRSALKSGIPEFVLGCLAAFRESANENTIRTLAKRIQEDLPEEGLKKALAECRQLRFLKGSGNRFEVFSATTREALASAVPAELVARIHQELFGLFEEENRPAAESFPHLAEAPAELVNKESAKLLDGLRSLVGKGSFSQARTVIQRVQGLDLKLEPAAATELCILEQELRWAETGDIDLEQIAAQLDGARTIRQRNRRTVAIVRLRLLLSQWYSKRKQDYVRAAATAEEAELGWGPFRQRLHLDQPSLEFDFYLNLWTVYYRLLNTAKFRRVDKWIWKRLAFRRDGAYDAYSIARFLGLLLELQREFPTEQARTEFFSRDSAGRKRSRPNAIGKLASTERIRGSFLDSFLSNPDLLNQENSLALGRLYLDLGAAYWGESRTKRLLASGETNGSVEREEAAETYMTRAERLFEQGGFRLDLAEAHEAIGGIYADRVFLAQKHGDREKLSELFSVAARWLWLAASDFEALQEHRRAMAVWQAYAEIEGRWSLFHPDRLGDAIGAYERLLALAPEIPDAAGGDKLRWTLVPLYEKAGRLDKALQLLDEMDPHAPDVAERRALIHAGMLMKSPDVITPENSVQFERELDLLMAEPADAQIAWGVWVAGITSWSDAVAAVAWHLTRFFMSHQEGKHALQTLRSARMQVMRSPVTEREIQTDLPRTLGILWPMAGTSDAEMANDFAEMAMPLASAKTREDILAMLDLVWNWEAARGGSHTAAGEMSLTFVAWSQQNNGDAGEDRLLVEGIFRRLSSRSDWENRGIVRLTARSLALVFAFAAPNRDASGPLAQVAAVLAEIESGPEGPARLQFMVALLEALLETHRRTQDQWFYGIIQKLAAQLRPLQNFSRSNFDEITQLINVYLQLPDGLADAVDLMERQCEDLLTRRDYQLLPNYLSFLSDLLGNVLREESFVEQILRRSGIQHGLSQRLDVVQSERAEKISQVATELCSRIVGDIARRPVAHKSMKSVLYNAAKLLKDGENSGLQAAVYVKLYEFSEARDGNCVWGVYTAWSRHPQARLPLHDQIALATYCNDDEDFGGRPAGSPRNYLISSKARNQLVMDLARRSGETGLLATAASLEMQRLLFLRNWIVNLSEFLQKRSEFDQLQWITFLYDYLLPGAEGFPLWQKRQRIEMETEKLENQIQSNYQQLTLYGVVDAHTSREDFQERLSMAVQTFLLSYRRRGKALMEELRARMLFFTLESVLEEVPRQLAKPGDGVDFSSILWVLDDEEEPDEAASSRDVDGLFTQDPSRLIRPLALSGFRLVQQGDAAAAERLYRYALRILEANETQSADLPLVLRGLAETLSAQKKFGEAVDVSVRLVSELESRSDPELSTGIVQLIEVLDNNNELVKALPYLQRKLEIDRARKSPGDPTLAVDLENHARYLRKLQLYPEAEACFREAWQIDSNAAGPPARLARDLYQIAVTELLQDRFGEAGGMAEQAWQLKCEEADDATAEIVFLRLLIALRAGEPFGNYLGILKTLITPFEEAPVPVAVLRDDHLEVLFATVIRKCSPGEATLAAAVAEVLDGQRPIGMLDSIPLWHNEPYVPLQGMRSARAVGSE